jgi:hypothetical protein
MVTEWGFGDFAEIRNKKTSRNYEKKVRLISQNFVTSLAQNATVKSKNFGGFCVHCTRTVLFEPKEEPNSFPIECCGNSFTSLLELFSLYF